MSLAAGLQDQFERMELLVGLLGQERKLLGEGVIDGEALNRLAAEKQQVLTAVSRFEHTRRTAAGQLGYGADPAEDERAAREQGCLRLWQGLLSHARTAARLNHFNGKLIDVRQVGNQRLINELRALSRKELYGPDGHARSSRQRVSSRA